MIKIAVVILLVSLLFTVDEVSAVPDEIKLSFRQGDAMDFSLENLLGLNPDNVEVRGIDFLSVEDSKIIANVPLSQEAGSYFGKFIVDGKEMPIVADVSSLNSPFDLALILQNREIVAGRNLNFYLEFKVVKPDTSGQIRITYEIIRHENDFVIKEENERTIGFSEIVPDSVRIPSSVEDGRYLLVAEINYDGSTAVVSEFFEVNHKAEFKLPISASTLLIIFVTIIALSLLFIFVYVKRSLDIIVKQHPTQLKQISSDFTKSKKAREALSRVNKLSELLGKAHKLGAIHPKHYIKSKKKISRLVGRIEGKFGRKGRRKSQKELGNLNHELELIEKTYRLGIIKKSSYEKTRKKILRILADYDFEI